MLRSVSTVAVSTFVRPTAVCRLAGRDLRFGRSGAGAGADPASASSGAAGEQVRTPNGVRRAAGSDHRRQDPRRLGSHPRSSECPRCVCHYDLGGGLIDIGDPAVNCHDHAPPRPGRCRGAKRTTRRIWVLAGYGPLLGRVSRPRGLGPNNYRPPDHRRSAQPRLRRCVRAVVAEGCRPHDGHRGNVPSPTGRPTGPRPPIGLVRRLHTQDGARSERGGGHSQPAAAGISDDNKRCEPFPGAARFTAWNLK